ncbi:MAG: DUF928 domain-containing protein [Gloeotrichia echinulata IR180]|jgi:hypothetical protein
MNYEKFNRLKFTLWRQVITICTLTTLFSASLLSVIYPPEAQAQFGGIFNRPRPEGAASGRSAGGATRSQCSQLETKNLIALVPQSNEGLTTEEHPKFWFYVPFGKSSQSPPAQLRLLDEQKKSVLSKPLELSLPDKEGIVYFSLPSTEKPLSVDQRYNWYFTITCVNEQGTQTKIDVHGWIKRVDLDSSLAERLKNTKPEDKYIPYLENNIWYEALSQLVEYRTNHQKEWRDFLSLYNLQNVAPDPISELKAF